jgi:hypothetical protein
MNNNDVKKPGSQFENEVDKVGMHVGKNLIDIIKIKVKKILSGKSDKSN